MIYNNQYKFSTLHTVIGVMSANITLINKTKNHNRQTRNTCNAQTSFFQRFKKIKTILPYFIVLLIYHKEKFSPYLVESKTIIMLNHRLEILFSEE